jgi:hypothetical protein
MEIIGFVVFQIVIIIVGLVASGILAGMMWRPTRTFSGGRKSATMVALFFPTTVLFYLEGAWLAYGFVEDAMGRDTYVEGIYHYSLAHDYQLVVMAKMPELAYIENVNRPSLKAISEVRGFQIAGNLIIVTSHKDESGIDWGEEKKADQFSSLTLRAELFVDFNPIRPAHRTIPTRFGTAPRVCTSCAFKGGF